MASVVEQVKNAAASAADTVTQAVQNLSLSGPAEDTEATKSAAEGRRLYIGNLAYSTTEDQLKEFFKDFEVETVSIPTNPRTSRAVGYAFVDVATKEEADRAITELSGKEVSDRKVSVQVARRPGSGAPASAESGEEATNGDSHQRPRRGRGGLRGRGRGRGGRARGGSSREVTTDEPVATDPAGEAAVTPAAADTTETAASAGTADVTKEMRGTNENRQPREKKKRGPPENGIPSTAKVMVANLPYDLTEEKLKELFAAYDPEAAKIALRPIPRYMVRKLQARNEPRKGRGFGFITLPNEELQKKAIEEMNGKEIEGRQIAVKVAIDNPKIEGEEGNENEVHGGQVTGENGPKEGEAVPVLAS